MLIEQINLFGEVCPVEAEEKPKRGRYKTLRELYGESPGHICRDCKHLLKVKYAKVYYKCALWFITASPATDIRVTKPACGKYEARQGAAETIRAVKP